MSQRNSLEQKRLRRKQRQKRRTALPAYVDLVAWIKLRTRVSTREAVRFILAGGLRADSHTLGCTIEDGHKVFQRYVPAARAAGITVRRPGR